MMERGWSLQYTAPEFARDLACNEPIAIDNVIDAIGDHEALSHLALNERVTFSVPAQLPGNDWSGDRLIVAQAIARQ
jgi:hypothetical protein